ncbi:DNA primase [Spirochaetia bacterium]|nr:DNA primase [Spirochaetia bacterium]
MGRISESTILEVQNRLDAAAVVNDYVRLEKKNGRYWACCPFHNEKTPSFTVDPDKKTYYCFGCQKGGSIINFLMETDRLSFPEAIETLAKRFGVPIIRENSGGSAEENEDFKKLDSLTDLYNRVSGSFNYLLLKNEAGKAAKDYILSRGISLETIERFKLGYAPADRSWLFGFLSKKGYSAEFLAESGLFSKNNPHTAFFSNRLIFPISNKNGKVVAFGGRILQGDGPKYLNSTESPVYKKRETLFAIDLAIKEMRATKTAILAEGYMDVISLHQAGLTNAVAPLGTAFTDEQAKLLKRWADRVILSFDSDSAGLNAACKAILICRKNGLSCSVADHKQAQMPECKDPADILKIHGAQALNNFFKFGILDIEFLLAQGKRSFNTNDSAGKAKAVTFLFPFLDVVDSEVERESCFRRIADFFGLEARSVLNDYKFWHEGKKLDVRENTGEPPLKTVRMNDELYLLTAIAVNIKAKPELWTELRTTLPIEEFENKDARELYIALEECHRMDSFEIDDVLSCIKNEGLKQFVVEKNSKDEFSKNCEAIVRNSIKRVIEKRLVHQRSVLVAKMRLAKDSASDMDELIHEKKYLDTKLLGLKGVEA